MKKQILIAIIFLVAANFLRAQELAWTVIGKMPYPVSNGQALFDGKNKIYILGGYSDSLQRAVDWIQEYDTDLNKWQIIGHLSEIRQKFVADFYQNKILLFGGAATSSTTKNGIELWDYSSATAPFIFDKQDNFDRLNSSGHIIGDNFYLIGGNSSPGTNKTNPSYLANYNIAQKIFTWENDIVSSTKPEQHMTFVVGNNIYIFGGVYNGVLNTIRKLNLAKRESEPLTKLLPITRAGGAATYNSKAKRGLLIGGYNETNNALATVELVQVLFEDQISFYQIEPMKYARVGAMAVSYEHVVLVFGGKSSIKADGKVVPEIEKLNLPPVTDLENSPIPTDINLYQNYPNPFNPSTTISFSLNSKQFVTLDIYSSLGEHLTTLAGKEFEVGNHEVEWNGKNKFNEELPSGVYFLQMRTNNFFKTRKMMLVK